MNMAGMHTNVSNQLDFMHSQPQPVSVGVSITSRTIAPDHDIFRASLDARGILKLCGEAKFNNQKVHFTLVWLTSKVH